MSRIAELFATKKAAGQSVLIGYITAGDPAPERTPGMVAAMERGGVDLIELGVPFSDPIADGPVIMKASERALAAGTTLRKVLEIARAIRAHSGIPILLFSYLNPLMRYGFEKLAAEAKAAGVDGCLLTDVSVEEAGEFVTPMRAAGLDTVFLAAPTSPEERLRLVAEHSSGFVYLVSRTGVTGEQAQLSASVGPLVEQLRGLTKLPLAVGFGISKPEQAGETAKLADGVVVGSAFVRLVEAHGQGADLEAKLEEFSRELKAGMVS
ncbi:MAG: tryptophan synthase subunit alpha [Acidobacteria bacterium]|nr:tryptophan synthase subunit alpha [Acidobacteriota bacterium]